MTHGQEGMLAQVRDPREDVPIAPFLSRLCFGAMEIGVSREDVCAIQGIDMLQP